MSVVNFNDITSFQFGLTWDETILQYDSVTDNLPPAALYNALNSSMGELKVSWFDFSPPIGLTLTPPDTVIFILHFTLLTPNVISTDVTFTSFPMFPIEVANTGGILNNADIVFESSTVTNVDITPPVISGCPTNISTDNDPGNCSATITWAAPTATDNCSAVTLISNHNSGETFPADTTTVTYTATDFAGNSATCSFDITVNDTEDPALNNCPTDISVNNDPDSCNAVVTWAAPTATDNCPGVTLTSTHNSGDIFPVGTTTITYTATDAAGNSVTCSFDAIVQDTAPPITLCHDITIPLDNMGNASITPGQIDNGSSDNCGISGMTIVPDAFTCAEVGPNIVTLTVTDVNGNSGTCTATVTVEDKLPPTAACQDITIQLDASGNATITGGQIDNGSTDACGIATLDVIPNAFDCSNAGGNAVTLTVTDVNGNSSTCTATVTVEDNIAPVAMCQNITVQLDVDGLATIAENAVDNGSADACGPLTFGTDITNFDCTNVGDVTVTLTVTDANGNSSTCTATVTVEDNTAPSITCPANIVASNDLDSCNAVIAWADPVVSDNCPGTTFTATIASGSTFAVGPGTTVTYTATDASGNTSTCSFTVTVNDDQAPVITCPSNITVSNDTDSCGAVVIWSLPTFSDNCGVTTVDSTHASGGLFPVGTTIVTYTANDAAGNSTDCSFNVAVNDSQAPVIAGCPGDMTVSNDLDSCNAVVSWAAPTATDNCPNVTVTCTPASGSAFPVGNTEVKCVAEDAAGNRDSCIFMVTVTDDQLPVLVCPADLTLSVPPGTINTVVTNIALVSSGDNCGVDTTYYHLTGDTSGGGPNDASGATLNVGTTTVTYFVEDAAGNVDSCSFDVTIQESAGLTLTCPSNVLTVNDADQCSAVVNGLSLIVTPQDSVAQIFYQMTGATPGSGPNDVSGTAFNAGVTTVTYLAQSNAGNLFTCIFTVQVNDTQPPAFLDCPLVNATVGNSPGMCGIKFAGDVLPLASDNCPNPNVVYSPTAGTLIPLGTTTISATATDAAGNTAFCSFDLIVVDDEAPQIANCPADISINNDQDNCSAIVPWTEPTATDNCHLLAFTPSQGPNTSFAVGVTPVEYVAVDDVGNVSKCTFNVTVVDSQAPGLVPCPVSDTVNTVAGECYAIAGWTAPAATDNCGVVSFSSNLQPGDTLSPGAYVVNYVATDPAGNETSCSFTLTVVDNEYPVITSLPANMTFQASPGLCGKIVNWPAPNATDNCGIDSFTSTASPGSFFAAGTTTTVEYVAVDVNGNATVESFTITVEDNVPPAFTCPGNVIVVVDGNIASDPSGVLTGAVPVDCENIVLNYAGVVATDDCGIATLVQTQGPASGSTFGLGSTIITYLATDNNGNHTTCSFTIIVGALPAAVADAFPLSPCEGEDVFFSVNQYTGATYTWKDANGTVVGNAASFILQGLTATQAGIYTVDISLPFCQLQSSVEVVISPNPQVEALANDLLCLGGLADLHLTASDLASAGVTGWIWEYPDGTFALGQNQTIPGATVDDAGTYTVTGITANGCASTATVEVVISNALTLPSLFGTDAAACINDAITLNGQTFFGGSVSYHWYAEPTAGAGLTSINNPIVQVHPSVVGDFIYHFYVVVDGCTSDTATWTVNVQAPPALIVSVDGQTECVNGANSITLLETGGEASSWIWTNSNGDVLSMTSTATVNNVTSANSDVYKVTASTTNGCVSVATLPVTITNQLPAATLIAGVSELCTGDPVTLTATPTFGANATFVWTGPNLPPFAPDVQSLSVTPGVTGNVTYSFAAVVDGCTTNTAEVNVFVEDTPTVNISVVGGTACLDGSTPVTLVPNSPGAVSWVWTNAGGGVIFTGESLVFNSATSASSGTYTVTVQSSIGCEGSGSYALSITDALPEISAVLDGPPCEGGMLYLNTLLIPGATYEWTGPAGNLIAGIRNPVIPNISSALDGDYTVTATKDGCSATSQPLAVKIITDPVVNPDNVEVTFETALTFSVVANDLLETDYDINIIQQPLHGNISYLGNGEYRYTPEAEFRETDRFIYEICYKDCPDACDFALVTLVVRHPADQCVITTVITPNDDGINDEFIVSCLEGASIYPNNKLLIFNQWGDKVFEAAPYGNNWRGTYEGRDLPDGTYFYIFQRDASSPAEKGFVMIYR